MAKDFIAAFEEIRKAKLELDGRDHNFRREFLAEACPLHVMDIIEYKTIKGYNNRAKVIIQRAVVKTIGVNLSYDFRDGGGKVSGVRWCANTVKINKDGGISQFSGSFITPDTEYKLVGVMADTNKEGKSNG